MIITKEVTIGISPQNKIHFEKLGYKLPYSFDCRKRWRVPKGSTVKVKVEDLMPTSNAKIKYSCDSCGKINEVQFYTMFTRKNSEFKKTGKTHCGKCANKIYSKKRITHGSKKYPGYRNSARVRGLEFTITPIEF